MNLSIKIVLILLVALISTELLLAQVRVKGYYRKDGTYVRPHVRSNPDGNPYNNWSYPGNTNPYTGKTATGNPNTYLKNYYDNSSSSSGNVDVIGYYRSDGTYVRPHKRTAPDGNPYNNWSYLGNTNPYKNKTATGTSNSYLNNYYNSSSTYSNINYNSDIDWEKIKKESDRFWREKYPKIQKEYNLLFESSYNLNSYSTSSYKTQQAVKYHYRYSRMDRKILELALQKLGYYIGIADGHFDEDTISGIKKFQRNSRVSADGKIGPNTMNKLLAKFF